MPEDVSIYNWSASFTLNTPWYLRIPGAWCFHISDDIWLHATWCWLMWLIDTAWYLSLTWQNVFDTSWYFVILDFKKVNVWFAMNPWPSDTIVLQVLPQSWRVPSQARSEHFGRFNFYQMWPHSVWPPVSHFGQFGNICLARSWVF